MKRFLLAIFLISPSFCFAQNEAARNNESAQNLAQNFFEQSYFEILSQQWKRALWDLEVVLLLDPEFKAAAKRRDKIREKLQKEEEAEVVPVQTSKTDPMKEEQRQKMAEAKKFLENSDKGQAILSLKEIIYKDPGNQRALVLLAQIESAAQDSSQLLSLSKEIEDKFHESFLLYQAGLQKKEKLSAYQKLKEAKEIFKKGELTPPFYKQLSEDLKSLEEILSDEFGKNLRQWESQLKKGEITPKELGIRLREANKKYPPHPQAAILLEKVYAMLEKISLPLWIGAQTIHELEGCRKSRSKFLAVQKIAAFEEIPSWQKSEETLKACFH